MLPSFLQGEVEAVFDYLYKDVPLMRFLQFLEELGFYEKPGRKLKQDCRYSSTFSECGLLQEVTRTTSMQAQNTMYTMQRQLKGYTHRETSFSAHRFLSDMHTVHLDPSQLVTPLF